VFDRDAATRGRRRPMKRKDFDATAALFAKPAKNK
jgi:hypothetical protein